MCSDLVIVSHRDLESLFPTLHMLLERAVNKDSPARSLMGLEDSAIRANTPELELHGCIGLSYCDPRVLMSLPREQLLDGDLKALFPVTKH